jgi:CHASE2 domain-containing sensor protein
MGRLRQAAIACADVELSGIGSQEITAAQWYGGIIQELVSGFELSFQRRAWMQDHEDLSPVQRLARFIETVLLVQISAPIVIFIDEIDSILGLNFHTDEFFALIRNCYDRRASDPAYQRLTFAILGVATPSDLIQQSHSTPFNIGKSIALQGFRFQDCGSLMVGLTPWVSHPAEVMREILHWTGGQPFLTQKLCWLVAEQAKSGQDTPVEHPLTSSHGTRRPEAVAESTSTQTAGVTGPPDLMRALIDAKILKPTDLTPLPSAAKERSARSETTASDVGSAQRSRAMVKRLVVAQILRNWEAQDEPEHLRTIRDRLVRIDGSPQGLLQIYRWVLQEGRIPLQETSDYLRLRLTGVVDVVEGQLTVKNPIYAKIFGPKWVEASLRVILSKTMAEPVSAAISYVDLAASESPPSAPSSLTSQQIQRDFTLVNRYCLQYEGNWLRTSGKSLVMWFSTADHAVQCSRAIQKALGQKYHREYGDLDPPQYRIGLHIGDLYLDGQDVMGRGVNVAAALIQKTVLGGICLSPEAHDATSQHLLTDAADIGEHPLNGLAVSARLYEIRLPDVRPPTPSGRWRSWGAALLTGAIASGLVLGIRSTGFLQPWEFRAFDQFMRARPIEDPDERLLLVTITDADIQAQSPAERQGNVLSDSALAELLTILNQGNPRAIGLDIFRQQATAPEYPGLVAMLAHSDHLLAACFLGTPGIAAPPEITPDRHGFNNLVVDTDGIVRRHLLATTTPEPCQTSYALSWGLAAHYLADAGQPALTTPTSLQLGAVTFPRLQATSGAYYDLDTSEHQILLNYRATPQIAESVTLREVLSPGFDPKIVQDRIVLIGAVASSFNPVPRSTPYSGGWKYRQRLSSVEVQAHMTSQLISAALDDRPLIWSWPDFLETIWIAGWILTASGVMIFVGSRYWAGAILIGLVVLATLSSWALMCIGGWIPFIPIVLGIAIVGVSVDGYRQARVPLLARRR